MIFEIIAIALITCAIYQIAIVILQHRLQRAAKELAYLRLAPSHYEQGAAKSVNNGAKFALCQLLARFTSKSRQAEGKLNMAAQLPELFDVLTIGFRSGMTLNACFGLYISNYQNELAGAISAEYLAWSKGLISADSALDSMSLHIALPLFDRFKLLAKRSVKYGVSIASYLGEFANSARTDLRCEVETRIAKAPVKMLIPTSVLILPAMLLLVLGPIILDMGGKMG